MCILLPRGVLAAGREAFHSWVVPGSMRIANLFLSVRICLLHSFHRGSENVSEIKDVALVSSVKEINFQHTYSLTNIKYFEAKCLKISLNRRVVP